MTQDNRKRIRTYHASDRRWSLHHGDVQTVLPTLGKSLYDASLLDPPYGLKFMGHDWDEVVPPVEVFQQLFIACKPGAFLVAFGGPKTFHRLTCNIEDSGWEIRDTLCWLYGEGFPKSHNLCKAIDKELGAKRPSVGETKDIYRYGYSQSGKRIEITTAGSAEAMAWDGYGTALKPAWEPIVLAQKPREENFAKNALRHGCGGLNIDGCRIGTSGGSTRSHQAVYPRLAEGTENRSNWGRSGHSVESINKGRWPANLILDEDAAEALDQQTGASRSRRCNRRTADSTIGNGRTLHAFRSRRDVVEGYDDEGGASRFFYVPKVRGKKRQGNEHPTVKPVELCEYLARLILPPERPTPRRLLVPYSGSGSEMLGALAAGWEHATGIEAESKWVSLARHRLSQFGPDAQSA